MSPLESGILGLYFLTLVILAILGPAPLRDGVAVLPQPGSTGGCPGRCRLRLPRVTDPAPDLQRDVRGGATPRVGGGDPLPDRSSSRSRSSTTPPTRPAPSPAGPSSAIRRERVRRHYLHREERTGYKAGALAAGLRVASGDLLLIFDADFVAPPDILEKTVGSFSDRKVGMVQVRWGHINRDYSLAHQVQSIMLDGHFVMEHGGRSRSGRFFNFNGTAGIWRRETIEDAGGWQHDTLTEDLDLSYRAQMRGWRFEYLQDLVSPAELPVEMNAFKAQQQRWAKGSVQTLKKLLPRVLASDLPWWIKVESTFHLTANLAYPLMVVLAALLFPAMVMRYSMGWQEMLVVDLPIFLAAFASVCSFYVFSQKELFPDRGGRASSTSRRSSASGSASASTTRWRCSTGCSAGPPSSSARPSTGSRARTTSGNRSATRASTGWVPYVELALGLYFTVVAFYVVAHGLLGTLPFHSPLPGGISLHGRDVPGVQGFDWRVPRQLEA